MDDKMDAAKKFLDEIDHGLKVFAVEWEKRVSWCVAAHSKEEAREAAENIADHDLDYGEAEIFVSDDLTEQAKTIAKKLNTPASPIKPDSGVWDDDIVAFDEYLAQRVWKSIVDVAGETMRCAECGYEDWTSDFNLNTNPPKFGHLPQMGCPECRHPIDWMEFVRARQPAKDDRTLSLFDENAGEHSG